MTPEILQQALVDIYVDTTSPPCMLVMPSVMSIGIMHLPETVWSTRYQCYMFCGLQVHINDSLPSTTYMVKCENSTKYLFCLPSPTDTSTPVKCWCGLTAAGCGGVHLDYCHPQLAGKSG
jgi:hypothetical protein